VPAFFIGSAGLTAPPSRPAATLVTATKEQILALVEPVAADLGLEILDVEFGGSEVKRVLRVFLDKPGPPDGGGSDSDRRSGVTLADCEAVSRQLGDVLDAHDAVAGRYQLEVSSPGVNRPLRKPEHFRSVVGCKVRIRLGAARDGSRTVLGRLASVGGDDQSLVVSIDTGEERTVAFREIERANLEYEFPRPERPGGRRR